MFLSVREIKGSVLSLLVEKLSITIEAIQTRSCHMSSKKTISN